MIGTMSIAETISKIQLKIINFNFRRWRHLAAINKSKNKLSFTTYQQQVEHF
jgi:hypothetical protein